MVGKKEMRTKEDKIGDALLKVALGYQVAEVTEEYAEVDGALKLTKRKKTKKDVPPDLKAVQMLLFDGESVELSAWTDEELEREKTRLLEELKQYEETKTSKKTAIKTTKGAKNTGTGAKTVAKKTSKAKKKK